LLRVAGVSWARAVGAAVVVNVVSHPALWFVVLPLLEVVLPAGTSAVAVGIGELAVVVVEAGLAGVVTRAGRGVCLVVAVAANAASLGVGLVLAAM
jgi:hypothetical protein